MGFIDALFGITSKESDIGSDPKTPDWDFLLGTKPSSDWDKAKPVDHSAKPDSWW